MSSKAPALEAGAEVYAQWLAQASDAVRRVLDEVSRLPAQGMSSQPALAVATEVSRPITEQGIAGGLPEALATIDRAARAAFNTYGPGYLAYIPGGGLVSAAIADLLADVYNRFTGITPAAPALVRLEADVLRWLCEQFGYGPDAYGLLTPGGSTANFSGFVCARVDRLGDDGDYRDAIAYTSAQAHHSVQKSLGLAGIPRKNLVTVATDARFRLDPRSLHDAIRRDKAAGRRPFLVVAAAGTTNSGAVDPLPALADICAQEGLWLHVDGAYGGAFVLCEEGKRRLAGIERADSVVFDPHKGMFLPYGTGCLLVRDGRKLRRAHQGGGDYLQDFEAFERAGEAPSPADYGPELSRDYRGLRLWLPMMLHGAAAFRAALAEKLELAEHLHQSWLAAIEAGAPIEVVDAPQLSLSTFRLRRRDGEAVADWDARNAAWMGAINARGRAYLSSTRLPLPPYESDEADSTAFTLRACILSFRTHRDRIDALIEDAVATAGPLA